MRIKKKNLARLSSLTALGAGALGVAAGSAEATVIYDNFGGTPKSLPSGTYEFQFGSTFYAPGFRIRGWASGWAQNWGTVRSSGFLARGSYGFANSRVYMRGLNGLYFASGDAAQGAVWNPLGGSQYNVQVAWRYGQFQRASRAYRYRTGSYPYNTFTGPWQKTLQVDPYGLPDGPKGPFYKLFRFTSGSGDLYGWAELNIVALGPSQGGYTLTSPTRSGMQVDLIAYAYSDNGYMLPAGALTESSSVPEPGSAGLMSLGALALGALGMRRWRAARKKAA